MNENEKKILEEIYDDLNRKLLAGLKAQQQSIERYKQWEYEIDYLIKRVRLSLTRSDYAIFTRTMDKMKRDGSKITICIPNEKSNG